MIYRIKMVENGKFVRYATDDEMALLRPKADGTGVEQVSICDGLINPINGEVTKYLHIEDVSATHEVEWGCIHEGKALYENDLVTAEYYLFQDEGKYNYHGLLCYDNASYCMGLGYVCVAKDKRGISDGVGNRLCEYENLILLGNINENPELMEKSNE